MTQVCWLQCSLLFLASQIHHELVNQASKEPEADGCQETSGECAWHWISLTPGAPTAPLASPHPELWEGWTPGKENLVSCMDHNGGWSSLLRQDSRKEASIGLLDKLRVPKATTTSHPAQGHTQWETGDEELFTAPYVCSLCAFPSCSSNL